MCRMFSPISGTCLFQQLIVGLTMHLRRLAGRVPSRCAVPVFAECDLGKGEQGYQKASNGEVRGDLGQERRKFLVFVKVNGCLCSIKAGPFLESLLALHIIP